MPALNLNEILDPTVYMSGLPLIVQMEGTAGATVRSSSGDPMSSYIFTTSEGSSTLAGSTFLGTTTLATTNSAAYMIQSTANNTNVASLLQDPPSSFSASNNSAMTGRPNQGTSVYPYFGTTIGTMGKRQRASIFTSATTIRMYRRSLQTAAESFTLTQRTTSSEPGTANSGQTSYNERTNRLIVVMSATSTYRVHVYTNPNINLNSSSYRVGDLFKFVDDAFSGLNGASYFYNDFTWSTTGSTSYTESISHNRFILGDNNIVGMFRMTPSNQSVAANMTLNSGSTTTTVTQLWTSPLTTSYGIEQGPLYGSRTQNDWGNTFVAAYCVYYYYGCGIKVVFFYAADPSKYYVYTYDDTQSGVSIAPQGVGGFMLKFNSANSDGVGTRVYAINPNDMRGTSINMNGGGVSNGGTVSLLNPYWGFDLNGSGTQYNIIHSATSWFTPMKTILQQRDIVG